MANVVNPLPTKQVNQYAVKLIQGALKEGVRTQPIGTGIYFTSVNIHNPGNETFFFVKIAMSGANGVPGPITNWKKYVLRNDEATEFDNVGFHALLGGSYLPFNEGFFVIECPLELDVVGVYTGSGLKEGQLSTMHMERVPKRIVPPGKY
jgi:hypothetical protein